MRKPESLRHDDLTEHLYAALRHMGVRDANVVATTEGAWVSADTLYELAEGIQQYSTTQKPNAGLIRFATELAECAKDREPFARY